jgi:hypothetical protein
VVPFAELVAVKEGAAQISIADAPTDVTVHEDESTTVSFKVKIVGGSDMFPTVTVSTNLGTVIVKTQVTLGVETPMTVTLKGVEGVDRLLLSVVAGGERKQQVVPFRVELSKVKRQDLDFG